MNMDPGLFFYKDFCKTFYEYGPGLFFLHRFL